MTSEREPMPAAFREALLLHMHSALDAVERDSRPSLQHWLELARAVQCVAMARERAPEEVADDAGAIEQALEAVVSAYDRFERTGFVRLTGAELRAVREAVRAWDEMVSAFTWRAVWRLEREVFVRTWRVEQQQRHGGALPVLRATHAAPGAVARSLRG